MNAKKEGVLVEEAVELTIFSFENLTHVFLGGLPKHTLSGRIPSLGGLPFSFFLNQEFVFIFFGECGLTTLSEKIPLRPHSLFFNGVNYG